MMPPQVLRKGKGYRPPEVISSSARLVPRTQPVKMHRKKAPSGIIRLSVKRSITVFMGIICTPLVRSNQGRLMPRVLSWDRE